MSRALTLPLLASVRDALAAEEAAQRFNARLRAIRQASAKLPEHLRPTPTAIPVRDAAARVGVTVRELRRRLVRRHSAPFMLDGEELLTLATVDELLGR